jgi:hypothetical protein
VNDRTYSGTFAGDRIAREVRCRGSCGAAVRGSILDDYNAKTRRMRRMVMDVPRH